MNLYEYIRDIQRQGLVINTVYDIGAWQGYVSKDLNNVIPNGKFILFEANPYYKDVLAATGYQFFIDVLSDVKGREVIYHDNPNSGESYYQENTIFFKGSVGKHRIANTIDSLVQEHNLPRADLIKIDTQGSELDIFNGAKSILPFAKLVYVECPIIEYNKNAPNMQDYLKYFDDAGFYPMNMLEVHHIDNILVQVDIMFMSKIEKTRMFGRNTALFI